MAKSLIIVESPAKARTIGKFLGKSYRVEASMGHVRDLPKSQLGINIEDGFKPKYITIRGKGPLLENLRKEAMKADNVLLATDPDREGEAISWHLAQLLGLSEDDNCRVEFHEITKKAVTESIRKPRKINMNLVEAQQARRILDRLVGYKLSPILWKKVKWGLSAGRVQSVAVKIICEREKEITQFIPKEYWTIDAVLAKDSQEASFEARLYSRGKKKLDIGSEDEAAKIVSELKDATYVVSQVKKGERKRNPAPPFTTSSMQQEAARKLRFTTKKTMMVAQQLYEGLELKGEGSVGLVTYIRTDSVRISDQAVKEANEYITETYGKQYIRKGKPIHRQKKNIQDAHEAIRPTSVFRTPDNVKSSLTADQYKLYKLIWERFVGSLMPPAVYDTVTVDIKAGDYTFRASGSTMKFPGFTIVYVEGSDEEPEKEEMDLPVLTKGQELSLKDIISKQHFTQPPPRFTEAMLVKALEEKGIGRPSTYAPIIDIIQKRNYVEKIKGRFKPTELGEVVINILEEHFNDIVDVDFTAEMEKQLDKIEAGLDEWKEVVKSFYSPFEEKLKVAEKEIEKVKIEDEVTDEKCELCGRNMVVKRSRFGRFLACPGFPECKNTKPIVEEIGVKCPVCGGNVVVRRSKRGKIFYGCDKFPECKFVSWNKPSGKFCPECGSPMVFKRNKGGEFESCSNKECGYKSKPTRAGV